MSRADLILKLTVGKDKCTVPHAEKEGNIRYFFRKYGENMKRVLLYNIIYTAIFALPLIFSLFVLPVLVNSYVYQNRSFIGNFGIGFPNVADSLFEAIAYEHYVNRILVYPCIILSVFIAFIGLSGVFHCSRGMMWGEKVKLKSFFRGIKALWKPFIVVGLVFSAVLAADLYGFGWHSQLLSTTGATAGSYILCVVLGLVTAFTVAVMSILLPSFACYNFKFFEHVKNAVLLFCVMTVPALFVAALSSVIFIIILAGSFASYIVLALLIAGGFFFISMMLTTFGQYLFENFIIPQVDKEGKRIEVKVKTRSTKELAQQYTGKKVKGKKQQNKGYDTSTKPNNPKKKKQQNTYNSSYKRKK